MQPHDIWTLAYHLSGVTLLGPTEHEPLGPLPYPVRTAVLKVARELAPEALEVDLRRETLNYLGGEYEYVDSWRFRVPELQARFTGRKPLATTAFSSVEDYYVHHGLRKKRYDGVDEHFAERLFVERVFVPTFGVRGLQYLQPQVALVDSRGRRRRIDFVLAGAKRYALEIEGAAFHARDRVSREKFEDEKVRQAELGRAGFTYVPFTFASLTNDYARAMLNDLSLEDPILFRLAKAKRERAEGGGDLSALHELDLLFDRFPRRFQDYQKLSLSLLRRAFEQGRAVLDVADFSPQLPLLAIAMLDTVALVERVAELFGQAPAVPRVNLHVVGRPGALHDRLLARYLGCEPGVGDKRLDSSFTPVDIHHVEHLPAREALDLVSKAESVSGDGPLGAYGFEEFERISAPLVREAGVAPPGDARPVSFERPLLDYFARRYFPYGELKPEQIQLVQRGLRGESCIGILPTGFGKSAVFQLYGILTPRTTIVISPLKALMRDQVHALRRRGMVAVEAISSSDSSSEKEKKLRGFREQRYRLLYLSPERLQIKSFYDELRRTMEETPIGAFVIDEAHCVSEWGHDFRPAYLQIAPLRKSLEAAAGQPIPVIGLTATASPVVREDIVSLLELDRESVVQLSSSDRPNLSLSVHPVRGSGPNAKDELVTELIKERIPRALRMRPDELLPLDKDPPFQHAGVVFAMYANPHGNTTIGEGVHSIAKYLRDNVTYRSDLVQVHASSAPSLCPECGSALYAGASKKVVREVIGEDADPAEFKYVCLECGHLFSRPEYIADWDETVLARQDEFKEDKFPLLVATKGYGMGVDKRNIRFIVHHSLSGGFEGYYQEAGRAGRDGRQAHAALVYAPPADACYRSFLKAFTPPPCVTDPQARKFLKCPMGLERLCDYGRQAHFVAGDYPGIEVDLQRISDLFRCLTAGETVTASDDDGLKATQLALYRLQQLGVISGYYLEYKSLRRVEFGVERVADVKRDIVREHVARFLRRTRASEEEIEAQLARFNRSRVRKEDEPAALGLVETGARIILERIYQEVPRMRYQMLTSQLDYATSGDRGECRRIKIRSEFDEGVALSDYRCGFCDVCQPDLCFESDRAAVPTRDAQVEDIAHRLPEILERFDPVELPEIVRVAANKGAVKGLYYKVSNTLEHDPTNLSALYLAGALARRLPEFRERALELLAFGYQEAERQTTDRAPLQAIYTEAKQVDPARAFSWIAKRKGAFDDRAGLEFLQKEAAQVFGPGATPARAVESLRRVRGIAALKKDLRGVANGVAELGAAIASVPSILE